MKVFILLVLFRTATLTESQVNLTTNAMMHIVIKVATKCYFYAMTQNIPCFVLCGAREAGLANKQLSLKAGAVDKIENQRNTYIDKLPPHLREIAVNVTDCLITEGTKIKPMDFCTVDKVKNLGICIGKTLTFETISSVVGKRESEKKWIIG